MKIPSDIRYANKTWMLMVLIAPLGFVLEYGFSIIGQVYLEMSMKLGGFFVLYWAVFTICVVQINQQPWSITVKKGILQAVSMLMILGHLFLNILVIEESEVVFYMILVFISTLSIWFFKLETTYKPKEIDIIDHLIDK